MKLTRLLAITFFCCATSVFSNDVMQECNKIDAKIEVIDSSNGLSNGQVKVELLRGAQKGLKYIFCSESGKVLNENQFGTNNLRGLGKGDYFCLISNSDCTKKISFTIK